MIEGTVNANYEAVINPAPTRPGRSDAGDRGCD